MNKFLNVGFMAVTALAVACGSGSKEPGESVGTSTEALTATQTRVLGFESPASDWSSPGRTITPSSTHSQGTSALAIVPTGWTEITSQPMDSLGPVQPNFSLDLQLPATVSWGEARLLVRVPSGGLGWTDLGGRPLSGLAAGVFNKLDFSVPSSVRTVLQGTYTDLEMRVVINAPSTGSAFLIDNLNVAASSTPPTTEALTIKIPRGVSLPNAFISTTDRLQVDDRVTLGTTAALPAISNFGSNGLQIGSSGFAHTNVYNAAGTTTLQSGATVRGFVRAVGAIGTQEPVTVLGGSFPNTPTAGVITQLPVTFPATDWGPVALPNDATRILAPGPYAELDLQARAKLYLRSGTYYFQSFNTEPDSQIFLDKTAGPIFLYVRNQFRYHGPFVENGGAEGQALVGYFGTSAADLEVGFRGTLVAPNARIELRRPAVGQHRGAFFGHSVQVFSDGTVLHVPFDFSFLCPLGDSDNDGTSDCSDVCNLDASKTDPGICGCGRPDTDRDNDKSPDCVDECPDDSSLQRAGICGCGDSPAPAGTPCDDSICRGIFTCDGQGHCGTASECLPPAPGCVPKSFKDKNYWFCPGPVSWDQAASVCRSSKNTLVQIDTVEENTFVAKNLVGSGASWTGANDRTLDGRWRWSRVDSDNGDRFWDGAADGRRYFARYTAWSGDAPTAGSASCGNVSASGSWSAASCSASAGFVCEVSTGRGTGIFEEPEEACEVLGIPCPGPASTGPCTNEGDIFGTFTDEQTRAALAACQAACSPPNDENSPECQAACTGPATPPPADSTCSDFTTSELQHCALESALSPLIACEVDSDCPSPSRCGFFIPCPVSGRDQQTQQCAMPNGTGELGSGKVCGTAVAGCPLNGDPEFPPRCGEVTLCDPNEEQTVTDPLGPGADLTAEPFIPEEVFGEPPATPETGYPDESNPCNGSCSLGQGHPWCVMGVQDSLTPKPSVSPDKHGNADGDLVSFSFDPKLSLMHSATIGAFGIPDLDFSAEAGFSAGATFSIAGGGSVPIIDVLAALDGTECGVKSRTTLDLFGVDFIPVLEDLAGTEFGLPLALPDAASQEKCQKAIEDFRNVANRAKKALRDALELVKQYRNAIENDASGVITDNLSQAICAQLVDERPRGFPPINCATASPEQTINAFIEYYERSVLGFTGLDGASDKLRGLQESAVQLAANAFVFDRDFSLYDFSKNDEIVVAQVQFFIGPIPVNLEILTTVSYGASIDAHVEFRPGEILAEMIRLNSSDALRRLAHVQAGGRPHAGVGLAAFAGVGFSVPGFTAKLGIESRLNLGDVHVPVHAGAGIGVGSEIDTRPPPADFADLVSGTNLIQPKRIVVGLEYTAGLGVRIRDILSGDVAGKLKIKVLFFSKTWRKTLLKFNGICSGDASADLGSPCDFTLVSASGSPDAASGSFPWGVIRPELPLPRIPRLPVGAGAAPAGNALVNQSVVEHFFYDSQCDCIQANDPAEDRECFRDQDCCPDNPVCFSNPATLKNECIECRHQNESCNEDDECCGGQCAVTFDGSFKCQGPLSCGAACSIDDECIPGAMCDEGFCDSVGLPCHPH